MSNNQLQELDDQLTALTAELSKLNARLLSLQKTRANVQLSLVNTFLPELSTKVLIRLTSEFPNFMTPTRLDAFKKNMPYFGVIPKKNAPKVLKVLQDQFQLFIEKIGIFYYEDKLIRLHQAQKQTLSKAIQNVAKKRSGVLATDDIEVTEINFNDTMDGPAPYFA